MSDWNKSTVIEQQVWEMEFQMRYRKTLEEIRELVKGDKDSEGKIRQTITEYLIQNKINEVLK